MNAPTFSFAFSPRLAMIAALAASMLVVAQPASTAQPQAARIDRITPAASRKGEQVTITGIGFGAGNVRITVGGVSAQVLTATGNRVTFLVPMTGLTPGATRVIATNPGGQTGSIGFTFLEGILLPGNSNTLARDSLQNFLSPPAHVGDVDSAGFILTRIDVRLAPNATVGQVNAGLVQVEGGIVAMRPGVEAVEIAVPRQASAADLIHLAATLNGLAGIRLASPGRQPTLSVLPFSPTTDNLLAIHHLLPARFPAAWNAAGTNQQLLDGCQPVPVLIQDSFGSFRLDFPTEVPGFPVSAFLGNGTTETHGFDVTTVLAAQFDLGPLTGANPFLRCLELQPLDVVGKTFDRLTFELAAAFPDGKFVVNRSFEFHDACDVCRPDTVETELTPPLDRAYGSLTWKEATRAEWDDFVVAQAAGNEKSLPIAQLYPGLAEAAEGSPPGAATLADPFFSFAGDPTLWVTAASAAGFPPLAATLTDLALLRNDAISLGLDQVGPASNILLVGSTTPGQDAFAVHESFFSDHGSHVQAVGECLRFALAQPVDCSDQDFFERSGTSFTAPQVAGLVAYLWLLSDDLRNNHPASDAGRAIKENVRPPSLTPAFIDAYAAALSLDPVGNPDPATWKVRMALLDVDGNGKFDKNDIGLFLRKYFVINGDPLTGTITSTPVDPTAADLSRFDLNGDGFTGGSRVERFDLDRVASTQYGHTDYSNPVTLEVGGEQTTLHKGAVTDLQILCFYAYSPLYTGDEAAREQLLAEKCVPVTVTVDPAAVTLASGATQQFGATVHGSTDPRVTWAVDGVNGGNSTVGAITSAGLYTAPSTAETHTVRAISVADPNAFADATVTVTSVTVTGSYDGTLTLCFNADTCVDPLPFRTLIFSSGGEFAMQEGGTCSKLFLITFASDRRSFSGVQMGCTGGGVIPGSHTVVEGTLDGSHLTYLVFDDRDPIKGASGSESFDGYLACSVPISSGCPR